MVELGIIYFNTDSGYLVEKYIKDNYGSYNKEGNTYKVNFDTRKEAETAKKNLKKRIFDKDVKYYFA